MQIPACLQGGSHVALGSKTKGRATPRGPSDRPRQTPARAASATSKSCMDIQQSTAIFISTLLQGTRKTESAGERVWTEYYTVNHLQDRHGTAGSHSWKSTNWGMCETGLRDRQAQSVCLEECVSLSVVYSSPLWGLYLKVHQQVVPKGHLRPRGTYFKERHTYNLLESLLKWHISQKIWLFSLKWQIYWSYWKMFLVNVMGTSYIH